MTWCAERAVASSCTSRPVWNDQTEPTSTVRRYYVYILASRTRVLYVGMTNDLERRVFQHKQKQIGSFTSQYNVDRLVHYEECGKAWEAIQREKEIKGWLRAKKVALIEEDNPDWTDLAADWH